MVRLETENEKIIAHISGDIDHHSAKSIREKIDSDIQIYEPKLLILDFKDVDFMDSSGIGLVMGRYKMLRGIKGEVAISNCPTHIKKVMKLAGIEKLVDFMD